MGNLTYMNIESVSKLIRIKEVSPVDLVKQTLERISKYDSSLRAYITVMEEQAMDRAILLEEELQKGELRGPLHGIPIAVKDNIKTKGIRTTGGSKIFKDWIPDEDATVVQKLVDAGAIIIGKANLHEFAMGATTENPHYGNTKNPWNLKKIPGGSSGGSAVATAMGMAFGAVGTDTAGSVRLPAAMCGTVGLKPTYGLVSREGCFPFSWSLDHIGPMTRTAKDAAIMLETMKGHDPKDPSSVSEKVVVNFGSVEDLKGVKLGFYEAYMFSGMDEEIKRVLMKAFRKLEALGAEIISIDLPFIDDALEALKIIAQSEVFSYHEPLLKRFEDAYGADLKYRFQFGKDISANAYIRAQRIRNRFISTTIKQMSEIDALIGPTNVQPPFNIGTMVPEQAISNMFTLGKTPLANILGFPAISIPCGFTTDHLPVGLQLIGKPFAEKKVLKIADCYERSENWVTMLEKNNHYVSSGTV